MHLLALHASTHILLYTHVCFLTHGVSNVEVVLGSIECVEERQLSLPAGIVQWSVPVLRRQDGGEVVLKRSTQIKTFPPPSLVPRPSPLHVYIVAYTSMTFELAHTCRSKGHTDCAFVLPNNYCESLRTRVPPHLSSLLPSSSLLLFCLSSLPPSLHTYTILQVELDSSLAQVLHYVQVVPSGGEMQSRTAILHMDCSRVMCNGVIHVLDSCAIESYMYWTHAQ